MRLRSYQVVLSRRTAKSVISLLMIVVLLLWLVVYPITTAKALGLITVVGTVTMTLAVLASVVMITMGASGMDGAVRNQAAATGTEPLTYMGQLLNRFAASAGGILPATFASKLQAGMSYLSDGTLIFDSDATSAIADFQRWAWDADGANLEEFAPIDNSSSGLITDSQGNAIVLRDLSDLVTISGTDYYFTPLYKLQNANVSYAVGSDVSGVRYYLYVYKRSASRYEVYVAPYNSLSCETATYVVGTGASAVLRGSLSLAMDTWTYVNYYSSSAMGIYDLPVNTNLLSSLDGFSADPVVIGDPDTFVGPQLQGKGTEIPLGDVVSLSPQAAANLHLANYLRAAAAAYAGTGTVDVPVTDVGTGDEDVLPLSVPLDTPLTVTAVTDSSIDQSGSIAGSDSVAGDFAGTDDFTMDLTQFFPFCVPFDLYAILSKFDAAAEAPVIDWVFDFGDLGQYPLQLDFSPFDTVAAILRDLETVAFAVGLILLTKRLIQGGD